uniref:Uncharacterized protein n=1 Tax=Anguilla anguilla TaxID=7936 RepID=A0A0E9VX90_ANGAN
MYRHFLLLAFVKPPGEHALEVGTGCR